ncbi:putative Lsm12 protein [Trypanosoma cruzi]|uniref:p21 antigen protein, putative n=2 Tax=Trypanosoma cruzi TaxID=5693 RepID=Q4D568_TRYCC|nr:p21 antigen protein, putative [Trypanosoma cruzi]EAN87665.1 p21 antigen protein, putative [Trypanosoma cruzi]PWV22199.1 putative Lsm12 protein [Trypanosoma cruzi]RNC38257.1 p21 antigen protein [Trypanosoma cruzi]|eukprot:XP_809516.1 p21 antigen protein [Trypanosoma cruzi strain CL Brener]
MMPSSLSETQAVGVHVALVLLDGSSVRGTVFTYSPAEELLVLFQGISGNNPNVKIIRTRFIKEVSVVNDAEAEKLPPQLDLRSRLPSMHAGRERSLFKYANSQLRVAREKRTVLLQTEDKDTPIAALDTLTKLARIYPDIHWDKEEGVIRFNQEVFVRGTPDWNTPVAVAADGATDNSVSLVGRIQKTLAKK